MQERNYSTLSPAERQRELVELFEQFPRIALPEDREPIDKAIARGQDRADSEHKAAIFLRLASLLDYSQITSHFRKSILEGLNLFYDSGRLDAMTDNPRVGPPRYVATKDENGIFEKESSKEIERDRFRRSHVLIDNMREMGLSESVLDQDIAEWRRQFTEFYGVEP